MKTSPAIRSAALVGALLLASAAQAQIHITEFFYQGRGVIGTDLGAEHEFVEFTNVGASSVDLTGWYYRDSTALPAVPFSLSTFGVVAPGETIIITDLSETDFRTVWTTLDAGVRVLGGAVPGLGRNDTIRLFDSADALVDSLAFGDQNFAGTPRFRFTTGITTFDNLGDNNIAGWFFSDTQIGLVNLTSANGDTGNPGYLNFALVPEPSACAALAGLGVLGLAACRRRRA